MIMASKIDLINSALILVGDKPLNSLTEDRRASVVAVALYDQVVKAEISKHRWGFARRVIPLNQLTTTPAIKAYRYAYQMPSDILVAVRLIPSEYDYKRYGKEIYSNQNEVSLDYISMVDESYFPTYFERLLTYALARDFATSIRDELNRFEAMDIRYKEEGRNARFQDSQEFPQDAITDSPFTNVRY